MPTTVPITIAPSGGDYSTLAAFIAGEETDISSGAGDLAYDVTISGDWTSVTDSNAGAVDFDGWNSNAGTGNVIDITCTGDAHFGAGGIGSKGTSYELEFTASGGGDWLQCLQLNEAVRIRGMRVSRNAGGNSFFVWVRFEDSDARFSGHIVTTNAGSGAIPMAFEQSNSYTVEDVIVDGFSSDSLMLSYFDGGGASCAASHLTALDAMSYTDLGGTVTAVNCGGPVTTWPGSSNNVGSLDALDSQGRPTTSLWVGQGTYLGGTDIYDEPWQDPPSVGAAEEEQAGGFGDGVGAGAITIAAPGVGASTASSVGAAAVAITAPGVGASTADAVASASVVMDAPGVGAALVSGVGAATVQVAATAVGESIASGVGATSVALDAPGVGASYADAVGSASLAFDAPAVSDSGGDAVGAAAITIAAPAVGAAVVDAVGSIAITLDAPGVGLAVGSGETVGSAAITLDAPAVGESVADTAGASSVALDAPAVGAALVDGVGAGAFTFAASAQGSAVRSAAAAAAIAVAVSGVGESTTDAVGSAGVTVAAPAVGESVAEAVGSISMTITATGYYSSPNLGVEVDAIAVAGDVDTWPARVGRDEWPARAAVEVWS